MEVRTHIAILRKSKLSVQTRTFASLAHMPVEILRRAASGGSLMITNSPTKKWTHIH